MTAKITLTSDQLKSLIDSYSEGESILHLSKIFNVSRPAITRALKEAGAQLRSQSEAETIKWSKLRRDPAAVTRQLKAAWKARKGSKDKLETQLARAQANYQKKYHVHRGEDAVGNALSEKGFKVEYQYPVGIYSVDIAIPELRIAVEIVGSCWKPCYADHLNKRTAYLLDQGWLVVFALIWRREFGLYRPKNSDHTYAKAVRIQPYFDPRKVAEHVQSLASRSQRGEKLHGQFGIISGNALPIRAPRILSDHLPRIPRA